MMCTTCRQRGDRNTTEIISSLPCTTNFQTKVLKNDSKGPIYNQFEHKIEELDTKHKLLLEKTSILRNWIENTNFYGRKLPFWGTG